MIKIWIAVAATMLPMLTLACDGVDRRRCQDEFRTLVAYRIEAIEGAFGSLFGILPDEIQITFVKTKDPDYLRYGGSIAYDRERATLILPRRILSTKIPHPLYAAAYYWPFYENEQYRQEFPVIEAMDNVLWNAYLQEVAHEAGLTWPHSDCLSVDIERRLPCEMLIAGIAEHIKSVRSPLFNTNRLDIIWPRDFSSFGKRVWRTDQEYKDVQRYGGILLTKPLIDEFGVPRALAYMAGTPFQVDDGNLQTSARRYQNEARASLRVHHDRGSAPAHSSAQVPSSAQIPRRPMIAAAIAAGKDEGKTPEAEVQSPN
jgi:hypothetical protein